MKKSIFIIIIILVCSCLFGNEWSRVLVMKSYIDFKNNTNMILSGELTSAFCAGFQFTRNVPRKPGWFVNAKFSLLEPGDEQFEEYTKNLYVAGLTIGMSSSTLLCIGLGGCVEKKYLEISESYYILENKEWKLSPYISIFVKTARTWIISLSTSLNPLQIGIGVGLDISLPIYGYKK